MTKHYPLLCGILLAAVLLGVSTSHAEDVEKKWRLSGAIGGYNGVDSIDSNAANQLILVNRVAFELGIQEFSGLFLDPRNDSAAFGSFDVQNGPIGTIAAQYAFTKTFIFEFSVGYQKSDVGDIEVSAQFNGAQPPIQEVDFAFRTFRIPAGELERIPIQLNAIWRFRPRAKFNPYVGVGIGYSFIGFEPSARLNELSIDMDASIGNQCTLTNQLAANPQLICSGAEINQSQDLQGARVEAGDTFEWNIVGGAEFTVKRKMAVFLDLRWVDASRKFRIGFNGADELGSSVPQLVDFNTSAAANSNYGAVQFNNSGLIDDGYIILVPREDSPAGTNCDFVPVLCEQSFIASPGSGQTLTDFETGEMYTDTDPGDGDGRKDRGLYYAQGGQVSYDGYSLQIGFRYTF